MGIMHRTSNYQILSEDDQGVVIKDLGPWDQFMTVTNDAESVVRRLAKDGHLKPGQRLFYFDSEGRLDEILVEDGEFVAFAPGPSRVED